MTIVFYTRLDSRLDTHLFNFYLSLLSPPEQEKILRFHRHEDQQASLLGKMLLLQGLLKFGYQRNLLKEIAYTEYKRPFINSLLDFNISHSGELIGCIVSDNAKVGVDVEQIRPVKMEDFKDVFSIDEYDNILGAQNSYNEFFTTWTRKEAVVKANGKGLYIPLKEISVKNNVTFLHNETWYLKNIFLSDNYSCSIATSNQQREDLLIHFVNKADLG